MNQSSVWIPGVNDLIASFLEPNEVSCSLRLVNKATAVHFSSCKRTKLSKLSPAHAFRERWDRPGALRSFPVKSHCLLVELTAASGVIENVIVALRALARTLSEGDVPSDDDAAQLCAFIRSRNVYLENVVTSAAGAGQLDTCLWLISQGFPFKFSTAAYSALRGGHLGHLRRVLQQYPRLQDHLDPWRVLVSAIHGCTAEEIQQLHREWVPEPAVPEFTLDLMGPEVLVSAAAGSPTPDWRDKVLLLEGLGHRCGISAALFKQPDAMERLDWMRGRGYPLTAVTAEAAVEAGNAAAVEHLLDQPGVGAGAGAVERAAMRGHVGVLRALHARGCSLDPVRMGHVLQRACAGGNLEVVVWLVGTYQLTMEQLEEWDAVSSAAASGSLELVRWLHEQRGCRLQGQHIGAAVEGGCEALLEWLVQHGCPQEDGERPFAAAAAENILCMLLALHRLGWPMKPGDEPHLEAAMHDHVPFLRCLHRLGYILHPTRETLVEWARQVPHAEPLQWLVEEAGESPWLPNRRDLRTALRAAMNNSGRDTEATAWLRRRLRHAQLMRRIRRVRRRTF